jgi:hypothetical protein
VSGSLFPDADPKPVHELLDEDDVAVIREESDSTRSDPERPGSLCPARPRSRLWWYLRLRRAYKLHGVGPYSRRKTWGEAGFSRRQMPVEEQRSLPPIRGPKSDYERGYDAGYKDASALYNSPRRA